MPEDPPSISLLRASELVSDPSRTPLQVWRSRRLPGAPPRRAVRRGRHMCRFIRSAQACRNLRVRWLQGGVNAGLHPPQLSSPGAVPVHRQRRRQGPRKPTREEPAGRVRERRLARKAVDGSSCVATFVKRVNQQKPRDGHRVPILPIPRSIITSSNGASCRSWQYRHPFPESPRIGSIYRILLYLWDNISTRTIHPSPHRWSYGWSLRVCIQTQHRWPPCRRLDPADPQHAFLPM